MTSRLAALSDEHITSSQAISTQAVRFRSLHQELRHSLDVYKSDEESGVRQSVEPSDPQNNSDETSARCTEEND